MRNTWMVMVLLLIFASVSMAGCVNIHAGTSETTGFSLRIIANPNVSVVRNWSAMSVEVNIDLVPHGKSVNETLPLVFVKVSDDVVRVVELGNYSLGNGVYLIPPGYFVPSSRWGWNRASFLAELRNGSYVSFDVRYRGNPPVRLTVPMTFEVNKTGEGYRVRVLITGIPTASVFGGEYKIVPYPINETPDFVGFQGERYLGNWTYILPLTNTQVEGNTKLVVSYPVANLYLVGNGVRFFLGTVDFPYDSLRG